MDPVVTSALISGGFGLLGGMQTNAANANLNRFNMDFQAAQANRSRSFNRTEAQSQRQWANRQRIEGQNWSARQAETNRAYQTEMANTEHQRAVADLKAAGLNPILAAGGGNASPGGNMPSGGTPGGASASSSGPPSGGHIPMQNAFNGAINSATSVGNLLNSVRMTEAQLPRHQLIADVSRLINKSVNLVEAALLDSDGKLSPFGVDLEEFISSADNGKAVRAYAMDELAQTWDGIVAMKDKLKGLSTDAIRDFKLYVDSFLDEIKNKQTQGGW